MDLTASLYITQKGADEVKQRVHKLGMKKRSVLIMLDKPKSIAHVIYKSVFPGNEVLEEVNSLIRDGFISLGGEDVPPLEAPPASAPGASIELNEEIILSEAKFLLIDFCVDSFGTRSQSYVDGIRACKGAKDLRLCLNAMVAIVNKECPARLPTLLGLVREINETA